MGAGYGYDATAAGAPRVAGEFDPAVDRFFKRASAFPAQAMPKT